MTFPIIAGTFGAILIFTSFKNITLSELLTGSGGSGENVSFLGNVKTTLASYSPSGDSSSSGSSGGATPGDVKTASGVTQWGSVQIASWIAVYLKKIGLSPASLPLTSGWRSPEYSRSLCQKMCHADSCPGKCAGVTSNHVGKVFPAGAIDVGNPATLEAAMAKAKKHGIPQLLRNDLPADTVHYSSTGH